MVKKKLLLYLLLGLLCVGVAIAEKVATNPTWDIQKTGLESYLDITYTDFENKTEFCIGGEVEFFKTYNPKKYNLNKYPIEKLGIGFELPDEIDLESGELCFNVTYENKSDVLFKLGWESVLVEGSGDANIWTYPVNYKLCKTPNGRIHTAYEETGSDSGYAYSDDGGDSWVVDIYENTTAYESFSIVCQSNNSAITYMLDSSGVHYGRVIEPDGTIGAITEIGSLSNAYYDYHCLPDSNDIIHCLVQSAADPIDWFYRNSTDWDDFSIVSDNPTDDMDDGYMIITDYGMPYVFQVGTDNDDLELVSPELDGWGSGNDIQIHTGSSWSDDEAISAWIGNISNKYVVLVAYTQADDPWVCNSSIGDMRNWDCRELDTASTYRCSISANTDGIIYVICDDGLAGSIDIWNSTYNDMVTWTKQNDFTDGHFPRILNQAYPNQSSTDRIEFEFIDSGDLFYDNISIEWSGSPCSEIIVNSTPVGNNITECNASFLYTIEYNWTEYDSAYCGEYANVSYFNWSENDCTPTGTCTCAGFDTDWEIDLSDNCNITTNCDLGTGLLNFTGSGFLNISAVVNASNMGTPPSGETIFIASTGQIRLTG